MSDPDATIIREEVRDRYTVVRNETIEDETLSFRALGLLVYILSKPDNWKTHVSHLASTRKGEKSEGREAVRAALTELEKEGYVTRTWVRDDDDPTPRMVYTVRERSLRDSACPETRQAESGHNGAGQTGCPENGIPGSWAPRNRLAQKPATSNDYKEVVITENTNGVCAQTLIPLSADLLAPKKAQKGQPTPERLDASFNAFYAVYPRKVKRGLARSAWPKAVKKADSMDKIIQAAIRYAQDPNLPEKRFIPYPSAWLNGEQWDDEPLPPTNGHRPRSINGTFQSVSE